MPDAPTSPSGCILQSCRFVSKQDRCRKCYCEQATVCAPTLDLYLLLVNCELASHCDMAVQSCQLLSQC